MSVPSFYHPGITKQEASELVCGPGSSDGTFLLRPSPRNPEPILTVQYKEKATHHVTGVDEDGIITLNEKTYGNHRTLQDLCMALGEEESLEGWPVRLVHGIDYTSAAPSDENQVYEDPVIASESHNQEGDQVYIDPVLANVEDSPKTFQPQESIQIREAHGKAPAQKLTMEEKQRLTSMEEDQRSARVAAAIQTKNRFYDSDTPKDTLQSNRELELLRKAQQAARDKEEYAQKKANENKNSIIQTIQSRKQEKLNAIPTAGPAPKKKVIAKLEAGINDARERELQAIKDAEEAAKEARALSEVNAKTAKLKAEKAAIEAEADAEFLDELPSWKRELILRQRAEDEAEVKRIEQARIDNVAKLKAEREKQQKALEAEREQRRKEADQKARADKKAFEAKEAAAARELKALQDKLALKI